MDVGDQRHALATLPHGKRSSTHCVGGCVGPRGILMPLASHFTNYLPPNVTPLIQPMDQGVIEYMKFYYQQNFLHKLVNHRAVLGDYKCTYTVRFSFRCCLCMEFSDGKNSAPNLEEIVASCNDF
jgi:hypothetical protein